MGISVFVNLATLNYQEIFVLNAIKPANLVAE